MHLCCIQRILLKYRVSTTPLATHRMWWWKWNFLLCFLFLNQILLQLELVVINANSIVQSLAIKNQTFINDCFVSCFSFCFDKTTQISPFINNYFANVLLARNSFMKHCHNSKYPGIICPSTYSVVHNAFASHRCDPSSIHVIDSNCTCLW